MAKNDKTSKPAAKTAPIATKQSKPAAAAAMAAAPAQKKPAGKK